MINACDHDMRQLLPQFVAAVITRRGVTKARGHLIFSVSGFKVSKRSTSVFECLEF